MNMITRHDFQALADVSDGPLISIYLPTHQRGVETEQDRIRLKNLAAEAERRLDEIGADQQPFREVFQELQNLHDDIVFWRHQGAGLAVLASADGVDLHRLPVGVEEFVHVGPRFCVRPLLASVSDGSRFHILAFSQHQVRLLECTRSSVREVPHEELPQEIRDVVGHDVEQKSLQFHTGAPRTGAVGQGRAAVHHGQGAGEDDEDKEIEQFLRAIDRGVLELLEGRLAPLVLAAVDREMVAYRSLSKHPHVLEEGIEGNHEHRSAEQLHADALPIVTPVLDEGAERRRRKVAETAASDLVALGLEKVLPAAAVGRVEVLVLDPSRPVWGGFDESSGTVEVHEERRPRDEDLLDLAMRTAMATGAELVPADAEDLPSGEMIAAHLRY